MPSGGSARPRYTRRSRRLPSRLPTCPSCPVPPAAVRPRSVRSLGSAILLAVCVRPASDQGCRVEGLPARRSASWSRVVSPWQHHLRLSARLTTPPGSSPRSSLAVTRHLPARLCHRESRGSLAWRSSERSRRPAVGRRPGAGDPLPGVRFHASAAGHHLDRAPSWRSRTAIRLRPAALRPRRVHRLSGRADRPLARRRRLGRARRAAATAATPRPRRRLPLRAAGDP